MRVDLDQRRKKLENDVQELHGRYPSYPSVGSELAEAGTAYFSTFLLSAITGPVGFLVGMGALFAHGSATSERLRAIDNEREGGFVRNIFRHGILCLLTLIPRNYKAN